MIGLGSRRQVFAVIQNIEPPLILNYPAIPSAGIQGRQAFPIVLRVKQERQSDLPNVVGALRPLGFVLRSG